MSRVCTEYSVEKHIEAWVFVLWQQKSKETFPLHLQTVCMVNHVHEVLAKQSLTNKEDGGHVAKDSCKKYYDHKS